MTVTHREALPAMVFAISTLAARYVSGCLTQSSASKIMQITKRSKLSLSQLLGVMDRQSVHVLLDKYDFDSCQANSVIGISDEMKSGSERQLSDLIEEIVRTSNTLRNGVSPRYKYDDRFIEFRKSLLLDGYEIDDSTIKSLDPDFEGKEPVEDELLNEISRSGLDENNEINSCLRASASDFIKPQPDYNGSLTQLHAPKKIVM